MGPLLTNKVADSITWSERRGLILDLYTWAWLAQLHGSIGSTYLHDSWGRIMFSIPPFGVECVFRDRSLLTGGGGGATKREKGEIILVDLPPLPSPYVMAKMSSADVKTISNRFVTPSPLLQHRYPPPPITFSM